MKSGIALAILSAGLLSSPAANNGVSFVAGRYYFELSYGDQMEFYQESYLPGSKIKKMDFRSVLRIELPGGGKTYSAFTVPALAQTARVTWNVSRSLVLAAVGERAFILTPQFHILKAYSNTEEVHWLSNTEIVSPALRRVAPFLSMTDSHLASMYGPMNTVGFGSGR
jgi:hypothetical protein